MTDQQWYWDLKKGVAVQADERGRADDLLGPYASQDEAEHWKERVEARNEVWQEADKEWSGDDEGDPDADPDDA